MLDVRVSSHWLEAVMLLKTVKLSNTVRLKSVKLKSVRLESVKLKSVRLESVKKFEVHEYPGASKS